MASRVLDLTFSEASLSTVAADKDEAVHGLAYSMIG